MLMFSAASDWQSLPSVPGRSSKRMVNSLIVGIFGFSFWYTSGMSWGGPARSKDVGILRPREFDCKAHPVSQIYFRFRLYSRARAIFPGPRVVSQVYTARNRRDHVATSESDRSPRPRVVLSGRFPNG